jgi:hypothetical protein
MIAVTLSLAFQAAVLSAPLVHAHPDDRATDHHGGRAVHSHWAGHAWPHHAPGTPALESTDPDRAVFLSALAAVPTRSLPALGVTHGFFTLQAPAERAPHRVVEFVHGHDPPSLRSLPPRAPPAFQS